MDGEKPAISVLMVVRTSPYAREAVASILAQTYKDLELLAVNNGGGQEVTDVLNSFNDPRIKIIENSEDVGLTKALNQALAVARGDYIARMDDDDVSMPERFAKQKEFLDTHLDIAAVGAGIVLIDEEGSKKGTKGALAGPAQIRFRMMLQNQLVHPSVMLRTEAVRAAGGYDESLRHAQDYELWSRLLTQGYALDNIPEPLLYYRIHPHSVTKQHSALQDTVAVAVTRHNISHYLALTDEEFSLFLRVYRHGAASLHEVRAARYVWQKFTQAYLQKENLASAEAATIQHYASAQRTKIAQKYIRYKIKKLLHL